MDNFSHILISVEGPLGMVQLNRPKVLNAISREMVGELVSAFEHFDNCDDVRAIVLYGGGRAFAAGADIDEMANESTIDFELLNQFSDWDRLSKVKKPIIGAVHGFALGGGFELALSCDILFAAEDAKFGFPEVNLGVMPGAGGTQRLTKLIGRTRALEWIWDGEMRTAKEAKELGVVNRLVAPELLVDEAKKYAMKLASKAPLSLRLIKDSVNKAVDYSLYEGMQYERKNFYLLFSSEDQKEGMKAFIEKRKPHFRGR
ncbi:enoyl-CoA hydratase-related protein [Falsibacillus albus]|uniref:Enoyl-CoA hydratase n=1 Tax=Falsibacillus albus TaxID=2478915 RepID=A0A3L7K343_9BACI|nr:enoyl-CoA hydratase-related protein [Falsibacillus albus]RLQ97418.1 enoyl-CoA hydratase [Falsibacillus albus]